MPLKKAYLAVLWAAVACAQSPAPSPSTLPIIDMHVHAYGSEAQAAGLPPNGMCVPMYAHLPPFDPGRQSWEEVLAETFGNPPCDAPIWSAATDGELMRRTIEVMERRNVIAVAMGLPDMTRAWVAAAPDRFIASLDAEDQDGLAPLEEVRTLLESGEFALFGEFAQQYAGFAPGDPRLEPYWTIFEELDIPVGLHMGEGPPFTVFLAPDFRVSLSNPLLLEDVLVRHPRLRIYVMHYGSPFVDEMIGMLHNYPQLYVEISGDVWTYPREYFYFQLKQFIDAGLGKRVLFGSDGLQWPELMDYAIDVIEDAPFLTEQEKRDILYNNAARFLRLTDEEIAAHHGR